MTRREKILAIAVAIMGIGVVGNFLFKKIGSSLELKDSKVTQLTSEIGDLELKWALLTRDKKQLEKYELQSLASYRPAAKSQYAAWLLHLASDIAKFEGVRMPTTNPRNIRGVYDVYSFKITAEADRQRLTRFLHKFYEVDFLHRIRDLNVRPKPPKKNALSIVMNIDVIGLKSAPAKQELVERDSNRLAHGELKNYESVIVGQNIFGDPNQPPSLDNRTRDLTPGSEQSMSLRVSAGERDQETEMEIISHEFPKERPPKIVDGRVKVFSEKEGTYKITLKITDTGLPQKSVTEEFTLNFKTPAVVVRPREVEFDESIAAFYTAFIETDNVPKAWISVRTSDRRITVEVGKSFEIGTVKGTVKRITPDLIEYEADGALWTIRSGESLQQAKKVSSSKPAGNLLGEKKDPAP